MGRSGIRAADWALGTMTFGNQTPEADAHRQMDMALDAGVTLWDCAEMYPVNPVRAETVGRSEEILGSWFAARGRRAEVVLATKVAGPRSAVRSGGYGGGTVRAACEASLRRLRTDAIDLYQLHWPERPHYHFRRVWGFRPSADRAATLAGMDEVLGQLADLVAAGLVRAVGVSNETAWGTARWLDRAEAGGGPRVASVQNEVSLLNRLADSDMAEVLAMEGLAMLAYSPLAAGLLTGKYRNGAVPKGSRMEVGGGDLGGRATERAHAAVEAYGGLAARWGMDPVHLALAWHRTRPFVSVPILGATTSDQLARQLAGADVDLAPELAAEVDRTHKTHPMPF